MKYCLIIFLTLFSFYSIARDSWKSILNNGEGVLTVYWFPNNVSFGNSKDIVEEVEYELAKSFVEYLNKNYGVSIELSWVRANSFEGVLNRIENGSGGIFGASSISVTPDRKEKFNFTTPYLSDIMVLISSPDIKLAQSPNEFRDTFQNLSAVSIKNTTLFEATNQLYCDAEIDFNVDYVSNSGQIIKKIESSERSFGYIDLPNFLVALKNSSNIRRQFFYPHKLEGLALIYSKKSDWNAPVNDYFSSQEFIDTKKKIILDYLGEDIINVIERVSESANFGPYEEIMISNRERELRYQELLKISKKEHLKSQANYALIIAITIVLFFTYFLLKSNRLKAKNNNKLRKQQVLIETRNNELKRLNEEKNDLIKVVAHDLRSPISNIQSCAKLIDESVPQNEESKVLIDYLNKSISKTLVMISKILDVNAIDSGSRNIVLEEFDPREVIKQTVAEYKERASLKSISIKARFGSRKKILCDKFYLGQVIDNLLSNALKYSDIGSEIIIRTTRRSGNVRIIVKDYGPGFSEEDKTKVFDKFHQLSAKPTNGESSVGLGLSIVKSFVDLINGKINLESKKGAGAAFYIDFKAL